MRILVVDDDVISLTMTANVLKRDHHVEIASGGFEAWERVRRGGLDLVVTDWVMPDMDGLELCRRIREVSESYVHIIMLTSKEASEDAVRALDTGADEFVRKPVDPGELQARVESILRLRELNQAIARQNEQLLRAQQLRKDWTSMIVHDLRTPLTAILGFSQLLQIQVEEPRGHLGTILQEAERVGQMLEEMLLMAKSEDGKLVLTRARFDLAELIRNQLSRLDTVLKSQELVVRFELPSEPVPVEMDRSLWRRLIDNLVSNAVKFSPEGSTVTIRLSAGERRIHLAVLDEGPGVPEKFQGRIFDKFETGIRRDGVRQCGLGLALCRLVAEAHGGTIRYRARSQGSAFEVDAPVGSEISVAETAAFAE